MIRVMNVISDTNIGGAGRVLINYLKYWDREHFDVSVALPRGSKLKEPLETLGGRVYEVDGMADKSLDFGAIKKLRALIRKVDPDIVHTHGSMSGRIAGRQEGKVVIYTRHSVFPTKGYLKSFPGKQLNGFLNHHYADQIVAVSPAAVDNLTEAGIDPKRVKVLMNGVEPVERRGEAELAPLREKYGLGSDDFVLGILARIEDYKGHNDILDALKLLREKGKKPKLLIAGTGNYEEQVKAHCKELGLENQVVFLGFVSDVAPILSLLDVQLNASWGTEATSLALLEGFSMGLPAVVSDYGGNPWLMEDGVNGYTFPTRDAGALARCLETVMDRPDRGKALGEGAKKIYEEKFTARQFAKNTEEIYQKAWEEKKHGKGN
ncbi:MAG: glycosyltransferase family 4 protein [Oscillospiraceae bacterium]|nr:glycosyltransferase family 4 protein [Oscillospiraceae bacterium]